MTKEPRNKDYWQLVWFNFKNGDRNSFEELFNEFADQLFAYGSKITDDRELLKDCIQDLFVDIYTYSPNLKNPELLEYYLYKSLKRSIIKKLKKEKRLESFNTEHNSFHLAFNLETDGYHDDSKNFQIEFLKKALSTLDEKKRELLFLKFDSGLSYIEIGDLLNMKPDTVKKQVYRIIQHLRDNFGARLLELFFICWK